MIRSELSNLNWNEEKKLTFHREFNDFEEMMKIESLLGARCQLSRIDELNTHTVEVYAR